jgi:hypothetical protein
VEAGADAIVFGDGLGDFMQSHGIRSGYTWYAQLQAELRLDLRQDGSGGYLEAALQANPPALDSPLPAAECAAAIAGMVYAALDSGLENGAGFVGSRAAASLAFEGAGELAPALLDMLAAAQQPDFHSKAELQAHLRLALRQLGALLDTCRRQVQEQEQALLRRAARQRRRAQRHLQQLSAASGSKGSGSDSEGCSSSNDSEDDAEQQAIICSAPFRSLLGPSLSQAPPRSCAAPGHRPAAGWWGLWGLLGSGSQVLGGGAAQGGAGAAGLLEAAARVLGLLLDLRLLQHVPGGPEVPAQLLANLGRLLRGSVPRLESPEGCICGACRDESAVELVQGVISCLRALVGRDPDLRLVVLESVHVLPLITALLGRLALPGPALELLELLLAGGGQPEAQRLAVGQPGLLQGLAGLLQQCGRATAVRVARLLRLLAQGDPSSQLEVAKADGVVAALVGLLGARSEGVANEAAEALAVLQQGGGEAAGLVRQAGRGLRLELQCL